MREGQALPSPSHAPTPMKRSALFLAALAVLAACDGGAPTDPVDDPGIPTAGVALYPVERGDRWGYMDVTGRLVVQPAYRSARAYANGFAVATQWEDGGSYAYYLRADGSTALKTRADEAHPFFDGRARVRADGRWGFIDSTGAFVINPY